MRIREFQSFDVNQIIHETVHSVNAVDFKIGNIEIERYLALRNYMRTHPDAVKKYWSNAFLMILKHT